MTTYTFPPNIFAAGSALRYLSNTKVYESPLTGAIQTQTRGGSRWAFDVNFTNLVGDDRAELSAFLVKLNGREHRVLYSDPAAQTRGNVTGTELATLQAAVTRGQTTATIENLPASQTVLQPGDYFDVNNELKMATNTVSSSAGGVATVEFQPGFRAAYSPGQAVEMVTPLGVFMLAEDIGFDSAPGTPVSLISSFSVMFMEDILMSLGT